MDDAKVVASTHTSHNVASIHTHTQHCQYTHTHCNVATTHTHNSDDATTHTHTIALMSVHTHEDASTHTYTIIHILSHETKNEKKCKCCPYHSLHTVTMNVEIAVLNCQCRIVRMGVKNLVSESVCTRGRDRKETKIHTLAHRQYFQAKKGEKSNWLKRVEL